MLLGTRFNLPNLLTSRKIINLVYINKFFLNLYIF